MLVDPFLHIALTNGAVIHLNPVTVTLKVSAINHDDMMRYFKHESGSSTLAFREDARLHYSGDYLNALLRIPTGSRLWRLFSLSSCHVHLQREREVTWLRCQVVECDRDVDCELSFSLLAMHNLSLTPATTHSFTLAAFPGHLPESLFQLVFPRAEVIHLRPLHGWPACISSSTVDASVRQCLSTLSTPVRRGDCLVVPVSLFSEAHPNDVEARHFAVSFIVEEIESERHDGGSSQHLIDAQSTIYMQSRPWLKARLPFKVQQALKASFSFPRKHLFTSHPDSPKLRAFMSSGRETGLAKGLLVGTFGAGKRTLAQRIADDLGLPVRVVSLYQLAEFSKISTKQTNQNMTSLLAELFAESDVLIVNGLELLDPKLKLRTILYNVEREHQERALMLIGLYSCASFDVATSLDSYLVDSFDVVEVLRLGRNARMQLHNELVGLVPGLSVLEDELIGYSIGDLADLAERLLTSSDPNVSFSEFKSIMKLRRSLQMNTTEIPQVSWDQVAGLDQVKETLRDYTSRMATRPRPTGILLHGPPGTGKTLLARALATQSRFSLLPVKGPELLTPYIGESEASLRAVFAQARSLAPCILFFDELDALVPKRGEFGDSVGVADRMVATFMTELDKISGLGPQRGSDEDDCVFVIGATNRPDLIDSALLRPGRLDTSILLGSPTSIAEQAAILAASCSAYPCASGIDYSAVFAQQTKTLSPAQIASIASGAMQAALERRIAQLSSESDEGCMAIDLLTVENLIAAASEL